MAAFHEQAFHLKLHDVQMLPNMQNCFHLLFFIKVAVNKNRNFQNVISGS